ncbi:MAG: efflux RND transporter periplasmic adaptor subunit [Methylococcaceae bacterium]|nr:MAG: efflux RND transporter periplasmic adaptor subunit [Methylococcaceae bacterium]
MLKKWLPFLVLLGGIAASGALLAYRPQPVLQTPLAEPPLVHTLRAEPQTLRLNVPSQGVVTPRSEIELVAEVSGKIVHAHPGWLNGGFFRQGEVLLTIDPRDYDLGVAEAEARIAEAQRQVQAELAQQEQARSDWRALGEGEPTPLALHLPQLAEARAKLKAATAERDKARLQRSRCELRAPFTGRVRDKQAGLGQYVQTGAVLARIYATDLAEVRLPLSAEQLGWLDLPLGRPGDGPAVTLSADLAGARRQWQGRIVRSEGALDGATGMLYAVAEVREPYAPRYAQPLLAGLFVQADIDGREQAGLFRLPTTAVNASQQTLVVDAGGRLHLRPLEILRTAPDGVWIKSGLAAGEQVVLDGVAVPIEGMLVRMER